MYSFYNTQCKNLQESFNNLQAAIKGHDDTMILFILRDNPQFATQKSKEGKTIAMLAAEHGCSLPVFRSILEKSISVLNEQTPGGETVLSILQHHQREQQIVIYNDFQILETTISTR